VVGEEIEASDCDVKFREKKGEFCLIKECCRLAPRLGTTRERRVHGMDSEMWREDQGRLAVTSRFIGGRAKGRGSWEGEKSDFLLTTLVALIAGKLS